MKLIDIPLAAGAAALALAVTACGANEKYGAAQRAEERAQAERQEAREAQADADKARMEAAAAQQRAQLAEQAQRDADQSAQVATHRAEQAEQSELRADPSVHRRTGVTERQAEKPILFASGTAELSADAKGRLAEIARSLRARGPGHTLIIEGYADESGSESANAELSRRRADAVASYLMSLGIPRDRVTSQGLGSRNPVSREDTDRGRALNRRAEIFVQP